MELEVLQMLFALSRKSFLQHYQPRTQTKPSYFSTRDMSFSGSGLME
jgi:hypothetical protein